MILIEFQVQTFIMSQVQKADQICRFKLILMKHIIACFLRHNSCPDIVSQLDRGFDNLSNSNWRYTTSHERFYQDPQYLKNDQETQTVPIQLLHVKHTGAQYSSPSDDSDSSSSDSDSDFEGTENIMVAKRYIHRHSISSEHLYTKPTPPNKRFRTSTRDPLEWRPEKEPIRCPLKQIVNHRSALQVPPVNIIAAPGAQATNTQCRLQ